MAAARAAAAAEKPSSPPRSHSSSAIAPRVVSPRGLATASEAAAAEERAAFKSLMTTGSRSSMSVVSRPSSASASSAARSMPLNSFGKFLSVPTTSQTAGSSSSTSKASQKQRGAVSVWQAGGVWHPEEPRGPAGVFLSPHPSRSTSSATMTTQTRPASRAGRMPQPAQAAPRPRIDTKTYRGHVSVFPEAKVFPQERPSTAVQGAARRMHLRMTNFAPVLQSSLPAPPGYLTGPSPHPYPRVAGLARNNMVVPPTTQQLLYDLPPIPTAMSYWAGRGY